MKHQEIQQCAFFLVLYLELLVLTRIVEIKISNQAKIQFQASQIVEKQNNLDGK